MAESRGAARLKYSYSMTWRIGLLIPSFNAVMEVDFYRSLPRDTTLHTGRMHAADADLASEERMLDKAVIPAAHALATARPHVVVFGCTSAALVRGKEYDRDVCEQLKEATGAITISTAAAVSYALRETCAASVAVVTPYSDSVNQRIKDSIEADGIEVSALYGMGLTGPDIPLVTPDTIYSFVQARVGPHLHGEALFLAGTDYQALSTLSLMKISYDVPMVTTNLAALQAVKRVVDSLRERQLTPAASSGEDSPSQTPKREARPWGR